MSALSHSLRRGVQRPRHLVPQRTAYPAGESRPPVRLVVDVGRHGVFVFALGVIQRVRDICFGVHSCSPARKTVLSLYPQSLYSGGRTAVLVECGNTLSHSADRPLTT